MRHSWAAVSLWVVLWATPAPATTLADLSHYHGTVTADNGVTFGDFGVAPGGIASGFLTFGFADVLAEPTADGVRLTLPAVNLSFARSELAPSFLFLVSLVETFDTNADVVTISAPPGPANYAQILLDGQRGFSPLTPFEGKLNFSVEERGVCDDVGCVYHTAPQSIEIHGVMPEPSTWVLLLTGLAGLTRRGRRWKTT